MQQVLVIDDSPTESNRFREILEKNGYEVLTSKDAIEGIEKAKKTQPDAILMDVVMPGLNGFQATRQLTRDKQTAHIPIIFVTTKDQQADKIWGQRQGAKGYLVKPVDESVLIKAIQSIMN